MFIIITVIMFEIPIKSLSIIVLFEGKSFKIVFL